MPYWPRALLRREGWVGLGHKRTEQGEITLHAIYGVYMKTFDLADISSDQGGQQ